MHIYADIIYICIYIYIYLKDRTWWWEDKIQNSTSKCAFREEDDQGDRSRYN